MPAGVERFASPTRSERVSSLIDAVRAFSLDVLDVAATPGLAVALALNGEMAWEAGFGLADVSRERLMTPDSVSRVGSISKIYTAIAVLQLVEAGVLSLDKPASEYVPELTVHNPHGPGKVRLRDLLTFQSGLNLDTTGCQFSLPASLGAYLKDAYAAERRTEYGSVFPTWLAPVGAQYAYSNLGIATLAYVVERTNPEGLRFCEYVQRNIFGRLGCRRWRSPRPIRARPCSTHLPRASVWGTPISVAGA